MRGLIPPGPFDAQTAEDAAARFRQWFGGPDRFRMLDYETGHFGGKLYLRYRIRMCPTADPTAARIAEQHIFADETDTGLGTVDLLCSGWLPAPPS
ncbi:MAG: hypothetical protein J2P18_00375 [Nocardia sp.]|nr:hypothetical protein [Nocardia sp.]